MTREYLLKAIAANDPDGNGVQRVIAAAKATLEEGILAGANGLLCAWADSCVLAHAWKASEVLNATFERDGVENIPHPFIEVVHWFDAFEFDKVAAKAVLDLLGSEEEIT